MPAIRAPGSRVQRHFSPLTTRTIFKDERFLDPVPIAYRLVYSHTLHIPIDPAACKLAGGKVKANSAPLIPKPPNEVTRLDRGGYNLETTLGWDNKQYKDVQTLKQKSLRELCMEILDLTKTWHEQTESKQERFLKAASAEFPILNNYTNAWPAVDFIAIHLKNKKQRVNKDNDQAKAKAKAKATSLKGKSKADEDEEDEGGEEEEGGEVVLRNKKKVIKSNSSEGKKKAGEEDE